MPHIALCVSEVAAFTCCIQRMCPHTGLFCAVFFYSGLCCHKIQLSGTELHLVVNLLDCFMAQRQIAEQHKTGSRYCSLSVFRGWASNTRKPRCCLFVSLWQTILPSYLGKKNWAESSILTVLDGLCAWYSMCDQLKHTAVPSPICLKRLCIIDCCSVWMLCVTLTMNHRAPHLFSSAKWLSDSSSSVSCLHVFPCSVLTWTIRWQKVCRKTVLTGNVIVKQECVTFWNK